MCPGPGWALVFPMGNRLSSFLAPGAVAGASLVGIADAPGMLAPCAHPLVLRRREGEASLPDCPPGQLAFPVAVGTVSRLESAVGRPRALGGIPDGTCASGGHCGGILFPGCNSFPVGKGARQRRGFRFRACFCCLSCRFARQKWHSVTVRTGRRCVLWRSDAPHRKPRARSAGPFGRQPDRCPGNGCGQRQPVALCGCLPNMGIVGHK